MPDARPASPLLVLLLVVVVVAGSGAFVFRWLAGDGGGSPPPTAPGSTAEPSRLEALTVEELKGQVAEIRRLEWQDDVPVRVVSADEMAQRIRDLVATERAKNPDDLPAAEAVLRLVQLIPDDLDLAATVDRLLEVGVLGFYDDESKEIFVRGETGGGQVDPATQSTVVHELTHALTDQHFDFGDLDRVLRDEGLDEESFALSALVEGDAEMVSLIWSTENLTRDQRREALRGRDVDPSAFADVPPYILESLAFPYVAGLEFVAALHDQGGFAAVNAAYQDPPTSTEEILHPDVYEGGTQWSRPPLPDLAAVTGCSPVDRSTVGEFDMGEMLDRHLPSAEAAAAAEGWNGDAYGLVRCGQSLGMADRWRADTPGDLVELADALSRWAVEWSRSGDPPDGSGRFSGPAGSGRILRAADHVDLVIADDASTADRLVAAMLSS